MVSTLSRTDHYSHVIVIHSDIFSSYFVKIAIGPGENDISRLQKLLDFLGCGGPFEGHSVVIGWRCWGEQFDERLHDGHMKILHGNL